MPLPFFALIAVLWALLWLLAGGPLVHVDTTRDLLLARDCAELGRCAAGGATTSFAGLRQGALWPDVLSAARLVGLAPDLLHTLLLGLHAVVVALTWRVTRSRTATGLALLGTGLTTPSLLWNPTLAWPLAALAALLFRARAVWLAALALGLAIDSHPVFWLPLAMWTGWLVGERQLRAARTLALVPVLVRGLASPWALVADAQAVGLQPWLALGPLLAGVATMALQRHGAGGLWPALGLQALMLVAGAAAGQPAQARYALAPLALALAWWPKGGVRSPLVAPLTALAVVVVWWPAGSTGPSWRYNDAAQLASELTDRGFGWPLAPGIVVGPDAQPLLEASAVWLAAAQAGQPANAQVAVVRRDANDALGLQWQATRLQWSAATLCAEASCRPLQAAQGQAADGGFAAWARPALNLPARQSGQTLTLQLPFDAGPVQTLRLDSHGPNVAWQWCDQPAHTTDRPMPAAAGVLRMCLPATTAAAAAWARQPTAPQLIPLLHGEAP